MKEGEKGKARRSTGGSSEEAAPWAVTQLSHCLSAASQGDTTSKTP